MHSIYFKIMSIFNFIHFITNLEFSHFFSCYRSCFQPNIFFHIFREITVVKSKTVQNYRIYPDYFIFRENSDLWRIFKHCVEQKKMNYFRLFLWFTVKCQGVIHDFLEMRQWGGPFIMHNTATPAPRRTPNMAQTTAPKAIIETYDDAFAFTVASSSSCWFKGHWRSGIKFSAVKQLTGFLAFAV